MLCLALHGNDEVIHINKYWRISINAVLSACYSGGYADDGGGGADGGGGGGGVGYVVGGGGGGSCSYITWLRMGGGLPNHNIT